MNDLISREAALKAVSWDTEAYMAINNLPSVQPKQGKNIYNTAHGHCEFKCSVCGAEAHIVEGGELDGGYFNYCPNCGAEMEPES